MAIDLKKEQAASLARPRYKYSLAAKGFFLTMDILTGKKITPGKAKLIEMLASIPYRAWEVRKYAQLTRKYKDDEFIAKAKEVMDWGREAQDNEFWHLIVLNEKMKEDGMKDPWYLSWPIPWIMTTSYVFLTKFMAIFNIKRAFLFNAEFEDHAEHVYAKFVEDNPGLDQQPMTNEVVKGYGDFETWGDVFRRIGLDERDHMNNSFVFCGMPEKVVKYEGMPEH
ncbi:MAG: hypothetical protein JEZ07_09635 [Phycisphaerae bacterium]|nr:hypothetical protein [Phycisphaerae bacterium]